MPVLLLSVNENDGADRLPFAARTLLVVSVPFIVWLALNVLLWFVMAMFV